MKGFIKVNKEYEKRDCKSITGDPSNLITVYKPELLNINNIVSISVLSTIYLASGERLKVLESYEEIGELIRRAQ